MANPDAIKPALLSATIAEGLGSSVTRKVATSIEGQPYRSLQG